MRREDKLKLPPRLKLNLPNGFHIMREPGTYLLYASYPVVDEHHHQLGTMTDLMGILDGNSTAQEIEEYARNAEIRLKKQMEHED